ncbi:hypothetical protein Trydic_g3477 [Trypoxylus dichotomus]
MCLAFANINEYLSNIEDNLNKLKGEVISIDKDYHIGEITSHIRRIRYHLLQIKGAKELDRVEMTNTEQPVDKSCDVPAEIIANKLGVPKMEINFRDKKIRKASSWKYLAKWESILEEQWMQQNNNEYDFRGINLVVPKRKHSIKKRINVSSTKEDFLDDMYIKKANSTECILERDTENETFENLEKKKYVSENDLNRNSLDFAYMEMPDCNYLLSLQDLERMGSLRKAAEDSTKQILRDSNRNNNDEGKGKRNSSLHKPKIVGVVYKLKL